MNPQQRMACTIAGLIGDDHQALYQTSQPYRHMIDQLAAQTIELAEKAAAQALEWEFQAAGEVYRREHSPGPPIFLRIEWER